jgi:hypothetical protein
MKILNREMKLVGTSRSSLLSFKEEPITTHCEFEGTMMAWDDVPACHD